MYKQENINGLWCKWKKLSDGDDCIVSIRVVESTYNTVYVLDFHRGFFPAFDNEAYNTLEELIEAMREIEPDLRKWKLD